MPNHWLLRMAAGAVCYLKFGFHIPAATKPLSLCPGYSKRGVMSVQSEMKVPGGRYAQKGFAYQNSIATRHLFELLFGGDSIRAVTLEASEPVDDIYVEREGRPNTYYQVKNVTTFRSWTPRRLKSMGIVEAFDRQLQKTDADCLLVLSSPLPRGTVATWADTARTCRDLGELEVALSGDKTDRDWHGLLATLGSSSKLFAFLRAYQEEPWPPDPDDVLAIYKGRYQSNPYAAIPGIWQHLRDIACIEGIKGRPIRRPELCYLLAERIPRQHGPGTLSLDIGSTRLPATPAWVCAAGRRDLGCSHGSRDFADGKPENILVMGDGGTGKSSFFAWLSRELREDQRFVFIPVTAEGGDPLTLIDSLNSALCASLHNVMPPAALMGSRVAKLVWLIDHGRGQGVRFIFAVDHVEALFSSISEVESRSKIAQARFSLMEAIGKAFQCGNALWILFARAEYFFLMFPNEDSRKALNIWWVRLQEFTDEEASRLLDNLTRISGRSVTEDGRRVFLERAPRNPLKFIVSYINLCSLAERSEGFSAETVLRVQPWESVFEQDFNSLDDSERDAIHAIASLMVISDRRVFSADEVYAELKRTHDTDTTLDNLRNVLHGIQDTKHLLLQPLPRKYRLYHDDFAGYVLERLGERVVARETMPRLQEFMAVFMHQSRSTLHAMLNHVELLSLRERDGNVPQEERLRIAERMRSLIRAYADQLRTAELFTASDEQQRARLVGREAISVRSLLNHVMSVYRGLAKDQDIQLVVRCTEGDIAVLGDEAMLSTALANIVSNALKYSFRGSHVDITVEEDPERITISVSNVGIGIAPEERERIFKAFYRGRQSRERFVAGSGIGLFVTGNIIRSLGGEISAESRQLSGGEGRWLVVIRIVLPRKR